MKTTRDDEQLERLFLEWRAAHANKAELDLKIKEHEKVVEELKLNRNRDEEDAASAAWNRLIELVKR